MSMKIATAALRTYDLLKESPRATQRRSDARDPVVLEAIQGRLRELIVKGFTLDDEFELHSAVNPTYDHLPDLPALREHVDRILLEVRRGREGRVLWSEARRRRRGGVRRPRGLRRRGGHGRGGRILGGQRRRRERRPTHRDRSDDQETRSECGPCAQGP